MKNLLPDEIKTFVISTQCLLVTEDETTGQGVDFRIEESNAVGQNLIPAGTIPSINTWLRIYRNIEGLELNRQAWFKNHGLKDPRIKVLTKVRCEGNLMDEISALQMIFRKKNYLKPSLVHTSLGGRQLHTDLKNFVSISKTSRNLNLQKVCQTRSFLTLSTSEKYIYLDKQEQTKKLNGTMKEMNSKINQIITSIPIDSVQEEWKMKWEPFRLMNTKDSSSQFLEMLQSEFV